MAKRSKIVLLVILFAMLTAVLVLAVMSGALAGILPGGSGLARADAELRYPYQQLDAKEKKLYSALYKGIEACEDTIKLPETYSKQTYEHVFLLVAEQEPQFFYLDSVYETAELMDTAKMHYKVPKEDIERMRAEMEIRADAIIQRLPSGADDIDRLLAIHDGIADNCEYTDGTYKDEAYGCLAEGEAKCEGYAKAFLFTARRAGMNVMNVTGTINGTENHVWNIAEANGKFYEIDVTWDDSTQYHGNTTHTCFAVSDAVFGDHCPDLSAYQPPICDDNSQNYYARNALIVSSASALPTMTATWLGNPMLIEFGLADDTVRKAAAEMLKTSEEMRNAVKTASGAVSYRAYMDENRNALVIMPS